MLNPETEAEKKLRDISTVVEDCAESFSDVAVHIEKWGPVRAGPASKRPKKLQATMRKLLKRLGRMEVVAQQPSHMMQQLPLGLIRHTSTGQSPNPWIAELFDIGVFENDAARGELLALSSFHQTLLYNLQSECFVNNVIIDRGKSSKKPLPPKRLAEVKKEIGK
ncbi:MAG: hypothetical protein KVP17_000644 [Porospora cf. gigantea B]|uniref:uncharacterized protein n=1 Tax=Porospora cf. gigantea B TaxID=2853592 RepID=UPI003571DDAE|nr:MAG: hypothetical protein KVP17_000644 [Porospora cf. gigantea B]